MNKVYSPFFSFTIMFEATLDWIEWRSAMNHKNLETKGKEQHTTVDTTRSLDPILCVACWSYLKVVSFDVFSMPQ